MELIIPEETISSLDSQRSRKQEEYVCVVEAEVPWD